APQLGPLEVALPHLLGDRLGLAGEELGDRRGRLLAAQGVVLERAGDAERRLRRAAALEPGEGLGLGIEAKADEEVRQGLRVLGRLVLDVEGVDGEAVLGLAARAVPVAHPAEARRELTAAPGAEEAGGGGVRIAVAALHVGVGGLAVEPGGLEGDDPEAELL